MRTLNRQVRFWSIYYINNTEWNRFIKAKDDERNAIYRRTHVIQKVNQFQSANFLSVARNQ